MQGNKSGLPPIDQKIVELARGIEPPTCGLQTLPDPPSDNLTPQEATSQDSLDMGEERASLPCPGSSVVAMPEDIEQ